MVRPCRMQFRGADELRIAATVRSCGETLDGHSEQTLAQEHDQYLELAVEQILIQKLHCGTAPSVLSQNFMPSP